MNKWRLLSFLFASLISSGCSVQKYFILANSTNQTISVEYSLNYLTEEKGLFGIAGDVYQSTQDNYPNWGNKLPFKDLNNSENIISIKLEAKSTLVFGILSNDKYDIKTKTSETGKKFNLREMTFSVNGVDYLIDENNFHDFFKEDGGTYKYVI